MKYSQKNTLYNTDALALMKGESRHTQRPCRYSQRRLKDMLNGGKRRRRRLHHQLREGAVNIFESGMDAGVHIR
jgi:hypothetical protein